MLKEQLPSPAHAIWPEHNAMSAICTVHIGIGAVSCRVCNIYSYSYRRGIGFLCGCVHTYATQCCHQRDKYERFH